MPTGLSSYLKTQVSGGVSDYTSGALGKGFLGFSLFQIAQSNEKLKETMKLLGEMALWRITWPATLLGMFTGIRGAIRSIVIETGSLEAALKKTANLQSFERQFRNLLGTVTAARRRVAELMQTARNTPFREEDWIKSNRTLELLTKGLYSSAEAMKEIGDAAAASGSDITQVAQATGVLADEMDRHESISQTADELANMGVISQSAARNLTRMQESGAGTAEVMSALRAEFRLSAGGMEEAAKTVEGAAVAYSKAKNEMAAAFGKPFVEGEKKGYENGTKLVNFFAPAVAKFGSRLSEITGEGTNVKGAFINLVTGSSTAQKATEKLADTLGVLLKMLTGLALFSGLKATGVWGKGILSGVFSAARLGFTAANPVAAKAAAADFAYQSEIAMIEAAAQRRLAQKALSTGRVGAAFGFAGRSVGSLFDVGVNQAKIKILDTSSRITLSSVGQFAKNAGSSILSGAGMLARGAATLQIINDSIDAYNYLATGETKAQRAEREFREEVERTTASLREQVGSIQDAGDQIKVLGNIYQAINDAEAKKKQHTEEISKGIGESALHGAMYGAAIGSFIGPEGTAAGAVIGGIIGAGKGLSDRNHDKENEIADEAIKRMKLQADLASTATIQRTPEEKQRDDSLRRRAQIEADAAYRKELTFGNNRTSMQARATRIGTLESRVAEGKTATDDRASVSRLEQQVAIERIKTQAVLQSSSATPAQKEAAQKSQDQAELSLIMYKRAKNRPDGTTGAAGTQAQGELSAINSAMLYNRLVAKIGGKTATKEEQNLLEKYRNEGQGYIGKSTDDLNAAADQFRKIFDRQEEIRANYTNNTELLQNEKSDFAQQYLSQMGPVANSLQKIGGGGSVAEINGDMLSQLKDQTTILKLIAEILGQYNPSTGGFSQTGHFQDYTP